MCSALLNRGADVNEENTSGERTDEQRRATHAASTTCRTTLHPTHSVHPTHLHSADMGCTTSVTISLDGSLSTESALESSEVPDGGQNKLEEGEGQGKGQSEERGICEKWAEDKGRSEKRAEDRGKSEKRADETGNKKEDGEDVEHAAEAGQEEGEGEHVDSCFCSGTPTMRSQMDEGAAHTGYYDAVRYIRQHRLRRFRTLADCFLAPDFLPVHSTFPTFPHSHSPFSHYLFPLGFQLNLLSTKVDQKVFAL